MDSSRNLRHVPREHRLDACGSRAKALPCDWLACCALPPPRPAALACSMAAWRNSWPVGKGRMLVTQRHGQQGQGLLSLGRQMELAGAGWLRITGRIPCSPSRCQCQLPGSTSCCVPGMWEFKRQNTFGAAAFTSCEHAAAPIPALRSAALSLLCPVHSRLSLLAGRHCI